LFKRHLSAVALALLICLSLTGCQTQLYGSLSETEANEVLAALLDASLQAEKRPGEEGTYSIFVEETHFAQAVRLLAAGAVPRQRFDDLGKVFGGDAMFSTPMEEKAKYLHAMQEELSHTVSGIDGVLSARVHLVLPEQDQLGRELQTPSAAVMIRYVDDERHDAAFQRIEIRRLVAASIPNLSEDRIVVSFFPVPPLDRTAIEPEMREALGLRLAGDSVERFWLMLGGAGALSLLLIVLLVFALRRKAKK
jgi:type III secretion protein J